MDFRGWVAVGGVAPRVFGLSKRSEEPPSEFDTVLIKKAPGPFHSAEPNGTVGNPKPLRHMMASAEMRPKIGERVSPLRDDNLDFRVSSGMWLESDDPR